MQARNGSFGGFQSCGWIQGFRKLSRAPRRTHQVTCTSQRFFCCFSCRFSVPAQRRPVQNETRPSILSQSGIQWKQSNRPYFSQVYYSRMKQGGIWLMTPMEDRLTKVRMRAQVSKQSTHLCVTTVAAALVLVLNTSLEACSTASNTFPANTANYQ